MTCQQPHPEHPQVLCDKDTPCYGYHANAQDKAVWPGTPLPPSTTDPKGKTRKAKLALIAQRAQH